LTCKTVSQITYTVLVETLNPAQSINQSQSHPTLPAGLILLARNDYLLTVTRVSTVNDGVSFLADRPQALLFSSNSYSWRNHGLAMLVLAIWHHVSPRRTGNTARLYTQWRICDFCSDLWPTEQCHFKRPWSSRSFQLLCHKI